MKREYAASDSGKDQKRGQQQTGVAMQTDREWPCSEIQVGARSNLGNVRAGADASAPNASMDANELGIAAANRERWGST